MGSFDEAFLKIPPEVIRTTIRNNQKCFVLRDGKTGKLANRFILVSNIEAADGGKAIVAGCERVIRARLSDAKFFYETDLKSRLEDRLSKFDQIVFHEKLGTQAARIARIQSLAGHLAPFVGADVARVERAAELCKADLLTEVVGEFPELQGLMGKYYALAQGEDEGIAAACEEHYKPLGAADTVPTHPVSVAVALADKIDMLVGFWAIDEKPTGSKDPYGLRRAALGVIRIVLDNKLRLQLRNVFNKSEADELLSFFADRLKVQLREQGARHDLVDAVFALEDQDDLVLIVRRVEASGNSSTPRTAKICSPATSARPTSFVSRSRRTNANTRARPIRSSINCPRNARSPRPSARPRRKRLRPLSARTLGARCRRWRPCARSSTPSSTRSRSMLTIRTCARTG